MASAKLEVRNICKSFRRPDGELMPVVDALSLSVTPLEFMALLGPSGCGKSTLLRMIDGLLPCDTGSIYLDGDDITGVPGKGRGMVFQTFDLFPWRTALGNVEFGLEVQGIQKPERRERARRYLGLVGLQGFEDSYPHHNSAAECNNGWESPAPLPSGPRCSFAIALLGGLVTATIMSNIIALSPTKVTAPARSCKDCARTDLIKRNVPGIKAFGAEAKGLCQWDVAV